MYYEGDKNKTKLKEENNTETKLNFLNLTDDSVFKKIMSIPEYVKDFVNAYLEYCGSPLKVVDVNTIPQKYIQNDNVALHDYYLDILVTLSNNEIYNIEIYNDFGNEQCKKSVAYTSWLYSHQLKKQETYSKAKKVTSINLITNDFLENNEFLNDYQLRNEFTSKILLNDLMDIVLIRLDKTPEKEYTKRKQRLNQWCRFIVANSYEKMKEVAEGDEMFMSSIEVIKDFVNDPAVINFKRNDKSRLIDVSNHSEEIGENKGIAKTIQALGRTMSCESIAEKISMPVKEVKTYMNMVL